MYESFVAEKMDKSERHRHCVLPANCTEPLNAPKKAIRLQVERSARDAFFK